MKVGSKSTPTISTAIAKLRKILDIDTMKDTDNVYGRAAQGLIPIVISVHEKVYASKFLKLSELEPEAATRKDFRCSPGVSLFTVLTRTFSMPSCRSSNSNSNVQH